MAKAETGGHAEPEFSVVVAPSPTVSMGMLEEDPDLKFAFSKNGAVREEATKVASEDLLSLS